MTTALCLRLSRCFTTSSHCSKQILVRQPKKIHKMSDIKMKQNIPKVRMAKYLSKNSDKSALVNLRFGQSDEENPRAWVKIVDSDPYLSQRMLKLKTSAGKQKGNEVLLEGRRLITDVLLAGAKLKELFFVDESILDRLPLVKNEGAWYKVSRMRLSTWSDLTTPPGVMAIVEKPNFEKLMSDRDDSLVLPVTVVCDNVREPGNLGSIVRSVAAAGVDKIIFAKGCASVWDQKVIRSAMGAHFRIPIYTDVEWNDLLANYTSHNFQMYLADSNSYEVMQEAESFKEDPSKLTLEDWQDVEHEDLSNFQLPVFAYYDVDFVPNAEVQSEIVVVIGGETEPLGSVAIELAHRYNGTRIHIPMGNQINSLNSASAISVILFEIKRQFNRVNSVK